MYPGWEGEGRSPPGPHRQTLRRGCHLKHCIDLSGQYALRSSRLLKGEVFRAPPPHAHTHTHGDGMLLGVGRSSYDVYSWQSMALSTMNTCNSHVSIKNTKIFKRVTDGTMAGHLPLPLGAHVVSSDCVYTEQMSYAADSKNTHLQDIPLVSRKVK